MGTVRTLFLDEALRLAALGYHVFQCRPRNKVPFTLTAPNGCNSATGNRETITRWWTQYPDCNIGLKCDNLLVLDIDNKHGKNGNADFQQMVKRLGPVPPGPVSQSGSGGYHLLFRKPDADIKGVKGVLWDGTKTAIDIQVGNQYIVVPPSLHPDTNKAYRWMTPLGAVTELPALPEAWIEFLAGKRLPVSGFGLQEDIVTESFLKPSSVIERCRQYLEKVSPCISGQGGDTQLFKAASVIFWDFGLSEEEGFSLLQEYNARCLPPWSESRLSYKMRQALESTHDKPRGHKLNENNTTPVPGVDLSGILVQTLPKTAQNPEQMPDSLLNVPGFVNEVAAFSVRAAPHPNRQLALLGALALQSFLVSRKVRSADTARPSLYLLALAGSGTGKDFPRTVNQHILSRIGQTSHIVDSIASGEGLEDLIVTKQTLLMQTDEFNFMLTDFTRGTESRFRTLESVILRLYSAVRGSYTSRVKAGKDEPLSVQQPGLVIFGTATPERFHRALNVDLIEGGFVSRCIIVSSDIRNRLQPSLELDSISDDILGVAEYWQRFTPIDPATGKPGNLGLIHPILHTVALTPDAAEYMNRFGHYADDQNIKYAHTNPIAAILWTRVHEAACRLALVYACSKNHREPQIDIHAARWACEFMHWTCNSLNRMIQRNVAENPFHATWLKIEDTIRKNGGHASQSLLINKLKISSKQLQEAVDAMGIGRRIALVEVKTKGRSRMEYTLLNASEDNASER